MCKYSRCWPIVILWFLLTQRRPNEAQEVSRNHYARIAVDVTPIPYKAIIHGTMCLTG